MAPNSRHHNNHNSDKKGPSSQSPLSAYDVMLGRGKGVYEYPGNQRLRQLCRFHLPAYTAAKTNKAKMEITCIVVNKIKQDGGRFLSNNATGNLVEVPDTEARVKVSQAMRHMRRSSARRGEILPGPAGGRSEEGGSPSPARGEGAGVNHEVAAARSSHEDSHSQSLPISGLPTVSVAAAARKPPPAVAMAAARASVAVAAAAEPLPPINPTLSVASAAAAAVAPAGAIVQRRVFDVDQYIASQALCSLSIQSTILPTVPSEPPQQAPSFTGIPPPSYAPALPTTTATSTLHTTPTTTAQLAASAYAASSRATSAEKDATATKVASSFATGHGNG